MASKNYTAQEMRNAADSREEWGDKNEVNNMLRQAEDIVEREAPEEQMERIVRDAILSYEQLYKDAPNDDSEREIIERCAIANGWLVSHGFARQAVSFDKEESPNL